MASNGHQRSHFHLGSSSCGNEWLTINRQWRYNARSDRGSSLSQLSLFSHPTRSARTAKKKKHRKNHGQPEITHVGMIGWYLSVDGQKTIHDKLPNRGLYHRLISLLDQGNKWSTPCKRLTTYQYHMCRIQYNRFMLAWDKTKLYSHTSALNIDQRVLHNSAYANFGRKPLTDFSNLATQTKLIV